MPHGRDLVCSYPECRAKGVKYLYCKKCEAPVSRKTFTKHCKEVHGDVMKTRGAERVRKRPKENAVAPSDTSSIKDGDHSSKLANIVVPQPRSSGPPVHSDLSPSPLNPEQQPVERPDQPQDEALQTEWDDLLLQRPRFEKHSSRPVSDWLLKVMSVSNRFTFGAEDLGAEDSDSNDE